MSTITNYDVVNSKLIGILKYLIGHIDVNIDKTIPWILHLAINSMLKIIKFSRFYHLVDKVILEVPQKF